MADKKDHTRHHVKNEDYPALIDRKQYHNLRAHYSDPWSGIAKDERVGTKQDLSSNGKTGRGTEGRDIDWEIVDTAQRPHGQASEANCRGTLVHGLTFDDVLALDIFEGTVSGLIGFPLALIGWCSVGRAEDGIGQTGRRSAQTL